MNTLIENKIGIFLNESSKDIYPKDFVEKFLELCGDVKLSKEDQILNFNHNNIPFIRKNFARDEQNDIILAIKNSLIRNKLSKGKIVDQISISKIIKTLKHKEVYFDDGHLIEDDGKVILQNALSNKYSIKDILSKVR